MNQRKKNNIIIGVLCCAVIFMSVGYAILSSVLTISSTANISGDFDIHFLNDDQNKKGISLIDYDNSTSGNTVYNTTVTTKAVEMEADTEVDSQDPTQATFSAILQKPTDYAIFTVTVKNYGTIDGYLTFSFDDTNNNFSYYDDFYSVEFIKEGTPDIKADILQNQTFEDSVVLSSGQSREYKIKVTFKESATGFPDTTTNGEFECTLNLTYSQQASSQGGSSEVCYTPLNETKQLRKIDVSTGESLGTATASNLSAGDLVGFGTSDISSNEQFYVLENNNGQLKLLSRYLINVDYTDENQNSHQRPWDGCSRDTRGLQEANIGYTASRDMDDMMAEFEQGYLSGTVPFSSTNFWWDSTSGDKGEGAYVSPFGDGSFVYNSSPTLKTYVDRYASTLSSIGLTGTTGTVLSIQELSSICSTDFIQSSDDISGCPSYVLETSYWLGSNHGSSSIYGVLAGYLSVDNEFFDDRFLGVRPVINVSLS